MAFFVGEGFELPKPDYEYVTTEEHARSAMSFLDRYDTLALDTETTGLNPYTSKISLVQIGTEDKAFVFDVRHDTDHSSLNLGVLDPILKDKSKLMVLQNAAFDMKFIKVNRGFYVPNVYDTMLAEQLLNLGRIGIKNSLDAIMSRYLGLDMPKEPQGSFANYTQEFQAYQLDYAANDVIPINLIMKLQKELISKEDLENVLRLEHEFLIPLCEMELNGIKIDVDKWNLIMRDVQKDYEDLRAKIQNVLSGVNSQTTLFGVSLLNIDSNAQLKNALKKYGIDLKSTDVGSLSKFKKITVINDILKYRKAYKLLSTYAQPLLDKILPETGRLHTRFKQMVSTGRLSSSDPNLQNIPNKQKFRSCFIAEDGYSLITSDMSSAELRIIGNYSEDPIFLEAYSTGQDLHTRTASEMFDIPLDEVTHAQRGAAKSINFGLAYGMSAVGLANRLEISKKRAEDYINRYFKKYKGVKKFLDKAARDAVMHKFSKTIAGRKRYYDLPPYEHPDRKKIQGSIERRGKNTPIQGCLVFNSYINGLGNIGDHVGKTVEIETGFGKDKAMCVYSGKKTVYNLVLSNGASLGITLDHKIPVFSEEGLIDKCVKDINHYDRLIAYTESGYYLCNKVDLKYRGVEDTYDLICENIHYFIANDIIVHNSNGDTIKEAMVLLVDRLKPYDARLILTVHDEVVVEVKDEQKYEVSKVVSQSLVDGFGRYFSLIPMKADALIGKCWLKGACENKPDEKHECGHNEMIFVPDEKRISKLTCAKCGAEQE
jgi:DNA polymerase I